MTFNAPRTASYALVDNIGHRTYYFVTFQAAHDLKMEFLIRYRLAGNKKVLSSPHFHLKIYEL